jgi:hypothetical protein
MTLLLDDIYAAGEKTGWDEVAMARWESVATCLSYVSAYNLDQIEAQIAYRFENPVRKPAVKKATRKVVRRKATR